MKTLYVSKLWTYTKGSLSQSFKPNVPYPVTDTIYDAAVEDGAIQGEAPASRPALDLSEAEIKRMELADLRDFVLSGGRAILSADLQSEVDQLKEDIIDLKGDAQDFIDGWNDGVDEGAQAKTLADCLAAVQLMKEQAAAGE